MKYYNKPDMRSKVKKLYSGTKISYMAIPGLKYKECKALTTQKIRKKRILDIVKNETGITLKEMQSRSRKAEIIFTTHLTIWLLKKYTKITLKELGSLFGGRDHTTASYAIGRIKNDLKTDIQRSNEIRFIENLL